MPNSATHAPPVTDTPIYWFVKLEHAVEESDFEAAAQAQRELSRLGVQVKHIRRPAIRRRVVSAS
jgi:hypothetical protein